LNFPLDIDTLRRMPPQYLHSVPSWFRNVVGRLWRHRGLTLRILFCWALGAALPFFDEVNEYDLRFQARGRQELDKKIILVYFSQDEWMSWLGPNANRNLIRSLKEFSPLSDTFFWHAKTWDVLLGKILAQNPISIGVTFYFDDQLPRPEENLKALRDPRVIWASHLDSEGRPVMPLMASSYGSNVALLDFREDEDRTLRKFSSPIAPFAHMGLRLAESRIPENSDEFNEYFDETKIINFRRSTKDIHYVSAVSILKNKIPSSFFKDKIVIIGGHGTESQIYQTPLGRMGRSTVLAQVVDNVLNNRWIARTNIWICTFYLLGIVLITMLTLISYPQTVAIIFLTWLALGTTAFSVWIFDSYYIWIPAFSPVLLIMISYMALIGYQLSVKENQTWRLEQETALLSELDQLRNNFVSLISHDLKTPIAKIQAICDRLLSGSVEGDVKDGLQNLRKESVELHRYIQSILQISRLEATESRIQKEAVDINELVEKVVSQLQPLATDKRQALHIHLEPLFSLEVDSVMLQEVILNLVENAIKYTPNDGSIEVRTNEIDDKVIFSVKDNGPGIPETDRTRIFEKFFRGNAGQTSIKGTGLGLFLVKYFIELHGGVVFLESDVGKGTRAGFTLPLQT
jgi:signal transduction histidine kinase